MKLTFYLVRKEIELKNKCEYRLNGHCTGQRFAPKCDYDLNDDCKKYKPELPKLTKYEDIIHSIPNMSINELSDVLKDLIEYVDANHCFPSDKWFYENYCGKCLNKNCEVEGKSCPFNNPIKLWLESEVEKTIDKCKE